MKYCARIGYLSLRIAIPKKTRIWETMNLSGRLTEWDIFRPVHIFACGYSQKGAEDIVAALHNFADIEPDPVRENAYLSSTFRE